MLLAGKQVCQINQAQEPVYPRKFPPLLLWLPAAFLSAPVQSVQSVRISVRRCFVRSPAVLRRDGSFPECCGT